MADSKFLGIESIGDEQLDTVTGGTQGAGVTPAEAQALAAADGRLIALDPFLSLGVCSCSFEYKWARSRDCGVSTRGKTKLSDIKCYCCGATLRGIVL